jgi:hypothetical protein
MNNCRFRASSGSENQDWEPEIARNSLRWSRYFGIDAHSEL